MMNIVKVASAMGAQTRFTGAQKQEQLYQWLSHFPDITQKRLLHVDHVRVEKGLIPHILLSYKYGKIDPNMKTVNQTIWGLLVRKLQQAVGLKAVKPGKLSAKEVLKDLRVAFVRLFKPLYEAHGNAPYTFLGEETPQ